MKAILFFLPLTGAALLAAAAEPSKTGISPPSVALSAANQPAPPPAGDVDATDRAYTEKVAERIVRTGAITVKPLRTPTQKVVHLFNPFAPLERAPAATPWLKGAPWGVGAGSATKGSAPVEMRHEPQFGVVICSG